MPTLPFFWIDAFTERRLAGNPCAVVFDADALDDAAMLAIAREMNLAETAFVVRSEAADFGARYWTPAEEIPLAGHPTVATVFALAEAGRLALPSDEVSLTLELRAGVIGVDVRSEGGRVREVVMSQRRPEFGAVYSAAEVMPVFGLSEDDALPGAAVQTVSTGTPMLMVPVRDHAALRRARMDVPAYERLKAAGDFFSPHLFCLGGATPRGDTFARQFGVPPDLPEDPFTGSATGAMAAYLWRHGLIASPRFTAEQGHWMGRPGRASVEVVGPPDAMETVRVGGAAVLVVRGEITV